MNPLSRVFDFAAKNPEAMAVASGSIEISYSSLVTSVQSISAAFITAGIKKGQVVAIATKPEFECISTLALLQIGAVSMTCTESVFRAYRESIDWLVSDGTLPIVAPRQLTINEDFFESLGKFRPHSELASLADDTLVRVVFSSGTTGTPKGVPFTLKNLLARIDSARQNWMPRLPFMSLLGLDTVTGMQTFFWSIMHGKTYFAVSGPNENLKLISKHKVKSLKTSPPRLRDLVSSANTNIKTELEIIQVAGSLLDNRLVSNCQAKLGITPTYLYGSTEVGTVTSGLFKTDEPNNLGRPVADIEMEITPENKIRYRKVGMPDGYWLRDTASDTGFLNGWFYPGDIGSINEQGELLLSGRTDDVVNLGGAKFNLLELDLWLQNSEMFDEVASFRLKTQEGLDEIGIAFVSANPPIPELLTRRIKTFLNDVEFKYLLRIDELPRNKLGKIDRKGLAKLTGNLD